MILALTVIGARIGFSKGLGFVIRVEEDIPRRLYRDDVRLRQYVMNRLSNAVKYTP